jgi:predicted ThiF/HesA family dinucleotide-utilizing enzyme
MTTEIENQIVIATSNYEKCLYVIGKRGMDNDILELQFTNKYAPTVEYLLRMLRKSFGWLEEDRGTKIVENTKCFFNQDAICICKAGPAGIKCTEAVRSNCKTYKKKYINKFVVNTVIIEKAGGIRGL